MYRRRKPSANIRCANVFLHSLESIVTDEEGGWEGGVGGLLCFEDRTPPQGLLSSENKSCKIFVIQPPLVLFREESRHISLLVNFTPCNHNFI